VPRLIAKGPDGQIVLAVDLDEHHALLLGRAPDARNLNPSPDTSGRPIQAMTVERPTVSANHAVVWCDVDTCSVYDAGSRNGTWLLLPKCQTVRVQGQEIFLQLAQRVAGVALRDEPPPPTWSTGREYAAAVARSIEGWLHAHGVEARASVATEPIEDGGGQPSRIPLATGELLDIMPLGTTTAQWSLLLEQLWRWTARQNSVYETEEQTRREGMILASAAIRAAHAEVVDAAKRGTTSLLLTGASGAGKEMLAEVFHRHSGRTGPFVPVNCAMFSKDLLRSELFGAEAGAFTGATHRILGAVERAQGGTLFLDEVGEIPIDVQPMLLRFLDRREFERLGQYGRVQRADVRVVAATNRDLREATRTGGFRADLWYRLSVYEVEVPPLRARWEDVNAYLETVRLDDGRCIREALTPEASELLRSHSWDGNFRELRSFAERLSTRTRGEPIDVATCRHSLERSSLAGTVPPPSPAGMAAADWPAVVSRALQAFVEDHDREPRTWDDQKEWNEKYLKPLLFFHLSGAATFPQPGDEEALRSLAAKLATRLRADRGTAAKQLERYFERFRG
jgi:DNA-binding NtrC family response regulator